MSWNPWHALRERSQLTLAMVPLPGGVGGAVFVPDRRGGAILLDRGLTQRQRTHALAHELVHQERDGGADRPGMPSGWGPVVRRDERQTDDEAVSRLVPKAELVAWCRRRASTGDPVEPHHVAEEWNVTEHVARRALEIAAPRRAPPAPGRES